jgi:AcrR family transcriptional regulator
MEAITRKRESGTLRKKQIKRATLEIISEEGLKRLSTKNLARHVHLSEGAIFRHFRSKEEILLSIMDDVRQELLEPLRKIAFGNDSPQIRLKDFMCYHLDYLKKNNGVTILLFTEAAYQNSAPMLVELNDVFRQIKHDFEKIVEDGISAGLWSGTLATDALSFLYLGIPITMSIEMKLIPELFTEQDFCPRMLKLVYYMLGTKKSENTTSNNNENN